MSRHRWPHSRATRNPREVLLHPHGTRFSVFGIEALYWRQRVVCRIGEHGVEPVEWPPFEQPRRNKLGSDGCTL